MVYIYIKDGEEYLALRTWLDATNLDIDIFYVNENQEHGARVSAHGMSTFPVLFDVVKNEPPGGGEKLTIFAQGAGAIPAVGVDVIAQVKEAVRIATTPPAAPTPFVLENKSA
jgi:hypothetical protein